MNKTTDLWFATFLIQQGASLHSFKKLGTRKAQFQFQLDDAQWADYRLAYFNSELNRFRQAQERLKDLSY